MIPAISDEKYGKKPEEEYGDIEVIEEEKGKITDEFLESVGL